MKKLFLDIVPKTFISNLTGYLTELRIPRSLRVWLYLKFSKFYEVNLEEVEKDLSEYDQFSKFFTRNLKPGLRDIHSSDIVSPVDAFCVEQGKIDGGTLIQAKGVDYNLQDLFNHTRLQNNFSNGNPYWTFYLAPGDYHNIHAPCSGNITSTLYIPGALYPVNNFSRFLIPNLYVKNERLITIIENDQFKIAVIKVGAMNVGSIGVEYLPDLRNEIKTRKLKRNLINIEPPISVKKGDKLGTFYLGSTVIVIANGNFSEILPNFKDKKIRLGEALL